jgi:hypothetical protein
MNKGVPCHDEHLFSFLFNFIVQPLFKVGVILRPFQIVLVVLLYFMLYSVAVNGWHFLSGTHWRKGASVVQLQLGGKYLGRLKLCFLACFVHILVNKFINDRCDGAGRSFPHLVNTNNRGNGATSPHDLVGN